MTSGGKFLVQRDVLISELWENKPSWWFKVWFYIIANANFKDHSKLLRRGDLLTTYEGIYRGCHLAQEKVKPRSIDNVIRWLKSTRQITTRKTTRGFVISVCNYNQLQSFETFTNDTENDISNDSGTTQTRHDKGTKETNETTYNYLPKSKTGKETNFRETPNLGTDTQPLENTQSSSRSYKDKAVGITTELGSVSQRKQTDPRTIFLRNLNRVKEDFDKFLSKFSPEQLEEDEWSLNTKSCISGIRYYLIRYKTYCNKDHVPIKKAQILKCFMSFNMVVFDLEELNLPPSKIDEVLTLAIDRWFATTSPDENNLRLNHFAGINKEAKASSIIFNSVQEVLYELGILSNAPKVVHLEDVK